MRLRHRREAKARAASAAAAARAAQESHDRTMAAAGRVRVVRAGGTGKFRSVCECTWRGPKRATPKQAAGDGWQHAQDEAAEAVEYGTYEGAGVDG